MGYGVYDIMRTFIAVFVAVAPIGTRSKAFIIRYMKIIKSKPKTYNLFSFEDDAT